MKKVVILTAALSLISASVLMAGTVTGSPNNRSKLAKEVVDNSPVTLDKDNFSAFVFTPAVDMTSLSIDLVFTGASAVNLKNLDKLSICGTDNVTKYKYKQASTDNKTLTFEQVSGTNGLARNLKYKIGIDNGSFSGGSCNLDAEAALVVDKGASSVTMELTNGSESMKKTLYTVELGTKASVQSKASYLIDYAQDFKKLYYSGSNYTTDNITLKFQSLDDGSIFDDNATTMHQNMNFTFDIFVNNNNGLDNITVNGVKCSYDSVNLKYSCSDDIYNFGDNKSVAILNVSGNTVIDEKAFTVKNVKGGLKQAGALKYDLITSAEAGEWKYRGVSVYVPLIGTNPSAGRETYIKLQSKDTVSTAGQVKAIILASDGTTVVANMGKIKAGEPKTITGADLKKAVEDQGKTVDGVQGFAAILNVATSETNLFGYANMVDPNGAKRIPLIINRGIQQ